MTRLPCRLLAACLLLTAPAAAGTFDRSIEAYHAMGIESADVLSSTALASRVMPGSGEQLVCVTTYFTGKKEKADAVNVRLDVFRTVGDKLSSLYTVDLGERNGGSVAGGDLQLVDLNMDGINEIIVYYDSYEDPLIDQRLSELFTYDERGFQRLWSGPVKYDATRAARSVPRERRDRYVRELDIENTLRTRGVTLFMNKTMISVAGERLPQPKTVQETFTLRQE